MKQIITNNFAHELHIKHILTRLVLIKNLNVDILNEHERLTPKSPLLPHFPVTSVIGLTLCHTPYYLYLLYITDKLQGI